MNEIGKNKLTNENTKLNSLLNETLSENLEEVAPNFRKSIMTEEQIENIITTLSVALKIDEKTAMIGSMLLFLQGAASSGTPMNMSIHLKDGKVIEKRNLVNACMSVTGHQYIRRMAEAMAPQIGLFANKNKLNGELAARINNKLRAETGNNLTELEMAYCSSFSQSIPNLEEIASERLAKLLAEDYQKRFENKKKPSNPQNSEVKKIKGKKKNKRKLFINKRIITEDLLIVSWKILKDSYSDFCFNYCKNQPISRLWFRKTAYLVSKGCFLYKDDTFVILNRLYSKVKSRLFDQVKFRIIELAFFFLLKSLFESKFDENENNYTLVEYLCMYIKKGAFFLQGKFVKRLDLINKNRLKNIILKVCIDSLIWSEIDKLLSLNLVGFSGSLIYEKMNPMRISFLSSLLFEIYFSEFDFFVSQLAFRFSSFLNNFNKRKRPFFGVTKSLNKFFPIKLEKQVYLLKSLHILNSKRYGLICKRLTGKYIADLSDFSFIRHFYFSRYRDQVILGIVGSKKFAEILQNKIVSFLSSDLHMNFSQISLHSQADNLAYFIGFNIRFFKLPDSHYNQMGINNTTFTSSKNKIILRLNLIKKSFNGIFVKRLNFELMSNLNKVFVKKHLTSINKFDNRIWSYLFQLESVRSMQAFKLLSTKDKFNLISSNLFFGIKYYKLDYYRRYSFKVFLAKSEILLKEIIHSLPSYLDNSVSSVDLLLSNYVFELKRKADCFYEVFTNYSICNDLNLFKKRFPIKFSKPNVNNHLIILFSDLYQLNSLTVNSKLLNNKCYLILHAPIRYLYEKLTILGFVHPKARRPIGNSKVLNFSDKFIVKVFGYFSYLILYWFRFVDNLGQIKKLIEFLRKSCLLTICRKHNKSKSWAYGIYTPNLVVLNGLFNTKSFFPTKSFVLKFQKDFIFNTSSFYFEEEFFLETF
uniref:putative group II intron reverse transcriptase/maturase mat2 n=1 Tax=Strombomonas costata TaxID=161230 RepID=UPI0023AB3110|nr:putative group II intron reverse transcriptase/maturase mat2 [Strombomonas costata]WCH63589.1 putative group II intron reverse transcriptase/maturase mat2 [Strombomonas costata]